jgi:hypothetical protein
MVFKENSVYVKSHAKFTLLQHSHRSLAPDVLFRRLPSRYHCTNIDAHFIAP